MSFGKGRKNLISSVSFSDDPLFCFILFCFVLFHSKFYCLPSSCLIDRICPISLQGISPTFSNPSFQLEEIQIDSLTKNNLTFIHVGFTTSFLVHFFSSQVSFSGHGTKSTRKSFDRSKMTFSFFSFFFLKRSLAGYSKPRHALEDEIRRKRIEKWKKTRRRSNHRRCSRDGEGQTNKQIDRETDRLVWVLFSSLGGLFMPQGAGSLREILVSDFNLASKPKVRAHLTLKNLKRRLNNFFGSHSDAHSLFYFLSCWFRSFMFLVS